jgi:hypothetical protein
MYVSNETLEKIRALLDEQSSAPPITVTIPGVLEPDKVEALRALVIAWENEANELVARARVANRPQNHFPVALRSCASALAAIIGRGP